MQWECKADLDERYKLGKTEVVCEGYNRPGDDYVLVGSCGVSSLDLTLLLWCTTVFIYRWNTR